MKKYLQLGILFLGISFLLKNCEIKEDLENLNQEQLMDLNLKTVSFEEAQNFFLKNQKENIKLFAAKGTEPLELTPNWNSIKHEDLYGIEQAQLTEVNVKINREGDYISKLLFIKINNITESIIFTIYQKEVDSKGKILEANFYLNKLNGAFIDGYKIEEGKITKQFILKDKNIQEASFFSFFQENQAGCWESAGCNLEPITVRARLDSGFSIIADVVGIYSVGPSEDGEVSTTGGGGGSGSSATGVAGSIYVTETTKTDKEGNDVNEKEKCIAIGKVYNETTKKCECPDDKVEDSSGNCIEDCTKYDKVVDKVLSTEGGYVNDPADPGGATNKGISWPVWVKNSKSVLNIDPTIENLKILTNDQAKSIYKKLYWDKIYADDIKDGDIRYMLFDFYVNAGGNAIKVLQRTLRQLGVDIVVDGAMGSNTIKAINDYSSHIVLYNTFKNNRKEYYNNITEKSISRYLEKKPQATESQIRQNTFKKFINGWLNRVNHFINKTTEINLYVNC